MNWSQLSGIIERIITAAVMYAVGKGLIPAGDAANIVAFILAIGSAIYAFIVNRNTNLVKQAASVPGATVVAPPEIADTLKANPDVLSTEDAKVVAK